MKKFYITFALVLLVTTLLASIFADNLNFAGIRLVYAADSHSNDIQWVAIYHHNGTHWVEVGNCTASSGQSYRVHDSWEVKFLVSVKFNSTLASSTSEAVDYTRVYMNITNGGSIWTNAELNNTASSLVGSFYIIEETGIWNQTGKPVAGVEYECKVDYDGYY